MYNIHENKVSLSFFEDVLLFANDKHLVKLAEYIASEEGGGLHGVLRNKIEDAFLGNDMVDINSRLVELVWRMENNFELTEELTTNLTTDKVEPESLSKNLMSSSESVLGPALHADGSLPLRRPVSDYDLVKDLPVQRFMNQDGDEVNIDDPIVFEEFKVRFGIELLSMTLSTRTV